MMQRSTRDAGGLARRVKSDTLRILRKSSTLRRISHAVLYDTVNSSVFDGLDWHERMLADGERVSAYRKGIELAIGNDDVVVDLGTGSGILAFMAAQAGARRVYAIDHSDFIEVAAEIGRRNHIDNVEFVKTNSRDFACPEPVDVILHEQMGHTIFGENMLQNLFDLRRRVLRPGGRILPSRFQLLVAPFSLKDEYRRPFLWEHDQLGLDLAFLREYEGAQRRRTLQHARLFVRNFEVASFLSPAVELLGFDLNDVESEQALATRHTVEFPIEGNGIVDGIGYYFVTEFDEGIRFDTSPFHRQTNWENMILRTEQVTVRPGQVLRCTLDMAPLHDPRSWSLSDVVVECPGAAPTTTS